MINALYEPFPETVKVNGEEAVILTDYREWIRFADLIHKKDLDDNIKIKLLANWFEQPPKIMTAAEINALIDFYKATVLESCNDVEDDESEETDIAKPVFDWCIDARYVIGDFRRCYHIDLLNIEYMHWWKFKSLFFALPDDAMCQKRIAYRSINLGTIKDDKERARIARIQRSIVIPYECEDDMISAAFGGFI